MEAPTPDTIGEPTQANAYTFRPGFTVTGSAQVSAQPCHQSIGLGQG